MTAKQRSALYWVLTVLFLLPLAGSGLPEMVGQAPAQAAQTLAHLGYPPYLSQILGVAKVLGAVAVLSNRSRVLKEWAYAGFTFDLLGAFASHLISGDGPLALAPLSMLPFVLGSRALWVRSISSATT